LQVRQEAKISIAVFAMTLLQLHQYKAGSI